MADNTIIQQGKFTSDGNVKTIALRSDVDWMRVINWTQSAGSTSGNAVEFFWQRGMAADESLRYFRGGSNQSVYSTAVTSNGFTLVDSSVQTPGAKISSITAVSTATLPVVSANPTTGLSNGDVVRLIDIQGAAQLGGYDFTIDSVSTDTSFRLPYMAQLSVAGTTGSYRKINFDPMTYPRVRYITAISKASSAVVKMSVTHGYTVGQVVKLTVPDAFGMTEMNGLTATITAINTTTNTITVNVDSSAFTTFAFPLTGASPFTPAIVTPVGEDVTLPNLSDDSVINTFYIGMRLAAGIVGPAGSTSDVMYWTAGKSFSVTNE